MYIDRMKRVRKFIAGLPAHKLKMSNWIELDYMPNGSIPPVKTMVQASCGTTACIAGWVQVMSGQVTGYNEYSASNDAQHYLGLSNAEADALFLLHWPVFLFDKFELDVITKDNLIRFDKLKPDTRKAAILRILDYIIEFGFTWLPAGVQSQRISQFGH